MSGHTPWIRLRQEFRAKPAAEDAIGRARRELKAELHLYESQQPAETVRHAELARRRDMTKEAIAKFEGGHTDEVRVSTLRRHLETLGARLELAAVFDDDERQVRIHLPKKLRPTTRPTPELGR